MKKLTVLSIGSTRGLWEGAQSEDWLRLSGYAAGLERYLVLVHSFRHHGLQPLKVAENFHAIPSNARTVFQSLWRMFWLGRKLLKRHRVDILQAQDPFALGLLAVVLGKWFRVPVNVCVYGPNVYDQHWLKSRWIHRVMAPLGRWVLRQSDGIQIDGRMTERSLVAAGIRPCKIHVKPVVPAHLDRFLAIERKALSKPVRLLFVGRLAPQKNLEMLLKAVNELRDHKGVPFELWIVGEGPEESRLRELADALGVAGLVRFCGALPRRQVVEAFAQADIFVLSSHFEGFARVLMEAAAAALPIVTTAVSGADEVVVHRATGYLVGIGDLQELTRRLAALLDNGLLRMEFGLAGREHIRHWLDPASNSAGQLRIWEGLAGIERRGALRS